MAYLERSDSDPKVGRTGWDVLASSGIFLFFAVVAVSIIALAMLYPDSLDNLSYKMDEIFEAVKPYLLPFIVGGITANYIYERYIFSGVLITSLDCDNNKFALDAIPKTTFERINTVNGPPSAPISTYSGTPVYLAKSVNIHDGIINYGDIHDPKLSPLYIFSIMSQLQELLKNLKELSLENVKLKTELHVLSIKYSADVLNSEHEQISDLLGINLKNDENIGDNNDVVQSQ